MKPEDCRRGARALLLVRDHSLDGAEVVVVRLTFDGVAVVRLARAVGVYGTEETHRVDPDALFQIHNQGEPRER
jgi:hypothetical protein